MEKTGIKLKTGESRLCEKVTLCVEPELKELWDFCNESACGLPESVRAYLRELLPAVRQEIIAAKNIENREATQGQQPDAG